MAATAAPALDLRPLLRLGANNPFRLPSLPNSSSSDDGSSLPSATEAFDTGIDRRDGSSCVVCRMDLSSVLDHAHLVPRNDERAWKMLQQSRWIPTHVKSQRHESRNGLLLCRNHHGTFDAFEWFVRFIPERNEYVFVNFASHAQLAPYHDCPLRLDPTSARAPFPSLFLYHEQLCWAKWDPAGILPDPLIRQSPSVDQPTSREHSHDEEDELADLDGTHTLRGLRRPSRRSIPPGFVSRAASSTPYSRSAGSSGTQSSGTRRGDDFLHGQNGAAKLYPLPLKRDIDPTVDFHPDRMRRLYGHSNWLNEDEVDRSGISHRWFGTALENMERWHFSEAV